MGGGMFALLSHHKKRCCCAFVASEVVLVTCRPRNVSIQTVSTEDSLMCYGRWPLQCQFVLSTFRDKLLFAQQTTRCSILCDDSSLSLMRPTAAMSCQNLMMRFVLCLTVQLWVIRVNNSPVGFQSPAWCWQTISNIWGLSLRTSGYWGRCYCCARSVYLWPFKIMLVV